MSIRYEIDWNKELRFDIGSWEIGTHEKWVADYPDYYGLYNNKINHSESTSFSITAYWEYLEFDYVLNAQLNYDYLKVTDSTAGTDILTKPKNSLTPVTFSQTFDGSLRTLTFTYRKNGSTVAGYDSCMILRMVVQTANNELVQFVPYFALKDNDTGKLLSCTLYSLVEIDIDLDSAGYDDIVSTFMEYTQDVLDEALALNTLQNASIISLDLVINRLWCEYYTIKHNSIIMDKSARDYTAHEYIEAIDTITITGTVQEGDSIGVAIGIDDDLWVLNNVDSEGNVVTYTTEELTPELILSLGFSKDTPVPDEIKSQLLIHRKLKFAYVLDVNSINSATTLNDVRGTFVTTLAASEE